MVNGNQLFSLKIQQVLKAFVITQTFLALCLAMITCAIYFKVFGIQHSIELLLFGMHSAGLSLFSSLLLLGASSNRTILAVPWFTVNIIMSLGSLVISFT